MTIPEFQAMVVHEVQDGEFVRRIERRSVADLPGHPVLIKVHYSSLNYKDALSASGNRGVTRDYPHTPGADAAGEIVQDASGRFLPGAPVLVTGYDLGMNTPGGFAEYIRVPEEWVVPMPPRLSAQQAMILGTAGFTAGLGIMRMQKAGLRPEQGEVLVTGATGGVGILTVALLGQLGYTVVASTGKPATASVLRKYGAARVIPREAIDDQPRMALMRPRWSGVMDTVGGTTLASALKSTRARGVVACCGNVAAADVAMTVYPFILRGIALIGINSAPTPMDTRLAVWDMLAEQFGQTNLSDLASIIVLDELDQAIQRMREGVHFGRTVIQIGQPTAAAV